MKKIIAITLVIALLALVGCSTTLPVNATSNPVGTKVGESTGMYLFNCIPMFGADAGIQKAAKKGNITNISTVDQKVTCYSFGLMSPQSLLENDLKEDERASVRRPLSC